ncbi:MAG: ComF family protein [Puniceicoccaceae bacterium]
MARLLHLLLERFGDLLYPRTCEVTNQPISPWGPFHHLAPEIQTHLVSLNPPLCHHCGKSLPGLPSGQICEDCRNSRPPSRILRSRAAVILNPVARHLIHQFKYQGRLWIVPDLVRILLSNPELHPILTNGILVPIPLAPARYRQRGFNQAEVLAREILRQRPGHQLQLTQLLHRIRETPTQTARSRAERFHNVRRAFHCPPPNDPSILGSRLILVDDVQTTGATLESAARGLWRAGARRIESITFAHG